MEDKRRLNVNPTIEYYENHSVEFIQSTINADMTNLYSRFEEYLLPGMSILDLGCGSGRDSRYFFDKGYSVVAIDPSLAMCKHTKELVDIPVYNISAEDICFDQKFDAVWACASLLHIKKNLMEKTLDRVFSSIRKGGVMYASWKYGENCHLENNKYYSDYTEVGLKTMLEKFDKVEIIDLWTTNDVRLELESNKWTNVILRIKS